MKLHKVVILIMVVFLQWNTTDADTACCCPIGSSSCPDKQLISVACPASTHTEAMAFTQLYTYGPLPAGGTCNGNETFGGPSVLLKDSYVVQSLFRMISGLTRKSDVTVQCDPSAANRPVVKYSYTCVQTDFLASICQRNYHQISSKTVGIWTDSYPNISTTLKNSTLCRCDVIVNMTSQIKVTMYDNTLNGSQTVKLMGSGGNVLQQWDSNVYVRDIGKIVTLNLSDSTNNLMVEWSNPNRQNYGSVWIMLEAVQDSGILQINCQEPIDTMTTIGTASSTNTSITNGPTDAAATMTKDKDSGSIWYVGLIAGLVCVSLAIAAFLAWRIKRKKVSPETPANTHFVRVS